MRRRAGTTDRTLRKQYSFKRRVTGVSNWVEEQEEWAAGIRFSAVISQSILFSSTPIRQSLQYKQLTTAVKYLFYT